MNRLFVFTVALCAILLVPLAGFAQAASPGQTPTPNQPVPPVAPQSLTLAEAQAIARVTGTRDDALGAGGPRFKSARPDHLFVNHTLGVPRAIFAGPLARAAYSATLAIALSPLSADCRRAQFSRAKEVWSSH
jgi:hypothetical protein